MVLIWLQACYTKRLLVLLFLSIEFIRYYLIFRCYLKLYDSPSKSSAEEDEEMSKLPPSQKKKLRQKQRKAEARAKKVTNFAASASSLS